MRKMRFVDAADVSPRIQAMCVTGATVFYVLVFIPAHKAAGDVASALAAVPIAAAGWFMGLRAGLLAGLLGAPMTALLFRLVGGSAWGTIFHYWPGILMGFLTGGVIGSMRDLLRKLKEKTRQLEQDHHLLKEEMDARRETEQSLRESEQRYRVLAESAEDFIFILNTAGDVEYANGAFLKAVGLCKERMTVKNLGDIFPPEFRVFQKRNIEEVVESNRSLKIIDKVPLPDREVWMDHCLIPLSSEGNGVKSVLCISRDISEQKLTEEDLERLVRERTEQIKELERQRSEIEKAGAAGLMAAEIAHEINNPLAGIKNSFSLVKGAIPRDYSHYVYVERIEKEIDRITRFVHQMFSLYQPDQYVGEEFRIDKAVNDVVALLESVWMEKGLIIDTAITPLLMKHDEGAFRQILYNILKNAIEASPLGGEIKIQTKMGDGVLTISISDQGPGIPEDMTSAIFEPFFSTKHGSDRGIGLGLSISKNLSESMGGHIGFESETGKGTVFRISLPTRLTKEIGDG